MTKAQRDMAASWALNEKRILARAIASVIAESDNPLNTARELCDFYKTKNRFGKTIKRVVVRLAIDRVVVTIKASVVAGQSVPAITVDSLGYKDHKFGWRLPKHADQITDYVTVA